MSTTATTDSLEAARALHRRALVIDAHADTLERSLVEGFPFGGATPEAHLDVPRLMDAGVNLQTLSLWVAPEFRGDRALHRALAILARFLVAQQEHPELVQVTRADQIRADRLGFVISIEGASPLLDDLAMLEVFHRLGVRMISLTWNDRTAWADGLMQGPHPGGLTNLGKKLVQAMGERGVVLDLAHIAEPGFWDAMAATEGPVAVSHGNARAVHHHPRNLTDEQIRALAERGGVMGLCFAPSFISEHPTDIDGLVRHVDHVVSLVGPAHLGLGTDYDGITGTPAGLSHVACLPRLTAALLERGYPEAALEQMLGLNWLRVFSAVWK